jgi:hypothetical protein
MRVGGPDGSETDLTTLQSAPAGRPLSSVEVAGASDPETELSLPYAGRRLRGDELLRRLDTWAEEGVVEPSCVDAVRLVIAHPEWLRLPDHTVAVLGAGAEMGPLPALLRWGARVAAVDLPTPALWERVLGTARRSAGTLLVPVTEGAVLRDAGSASAGDVRDERAIAAAAGADLIREVPEVADWITGMPRTPVVGNYVYADGAMNVRVSVAVDVLTTRLQAARNDVALAFLATPTDVFAVPGDAVAHSTRAYEARSSTAKVLGRPLRTLSGGRLLQRAYVPGSDPGILDAIVVQQGPNYALAKRLQRWRASVARDAGATVSLTVAPPTRTRSVLRNRALSAAYAGAHRFGIEVFEPATSNVLMAALLVHDLHVGSGSTRGARASGGSGGVDVGSGHPWQEEARAAVHGGLWRGPYAPRSALGIAALIGYGSART